jgi:Protein of unknown function (DUF3891)
VFRSRQRPVVYPQAEHSRLAGAIAAAWGNDDVERPPLPFDSFVRGVAVHDRGYGELDDDPLGEMPQERWLEIARRGFAAQDADPIADVVVAMHIQRLVSTTPFPVEPAVRAEFDAAVPERIRAAGVDAAAAAATDPVTDLCDRLAFSFCFEQAASGAIEIPQRGRAPVAVSYSLDEGGSATFSPWPLAVPELTRTVVGYEADGYPERLEPVERMFALRR